MRTMSAARPRRRVGQPEKGAHQGSNLGPADLFWRFCQALGRSVFPLKTPNKPWKIKHIFWKKPDGSRSMSNRKNRGGRGRADPVHARRQRASKIAALAEQGATAGERSAAEAALERIHVASAGRAVAHPIKKPAFTEAVVKALPVPPRGNRILFRWPPQPDLGCASRLLAAGPTSSITGTRPPASSAATPSVRFLAGVLARRAPKPSGCGRSLMPVVIRVVKSRNRKRHQQLPISL